MEIKNQCKALRIKWLWKYSNENQNPWGTIIKVKYDENDNWMTKEVTTSYAGADPHWTFRVLEHPMLLGLFKMPTG